MIRTLAIAAVVVLAACQDAPPPALVQVPHDDAQEILESTPWLDKVPKDERDIINVYFFQDGEGIYIIGNSYKATLELIRYWLESDTLKLRFLDENKAYETKWKIEKYRGEVFDYKLTLTKSPRGPKVYYGFASEHGSELPAFVTRIMKLAEQP